MIVGETVMSVEGKSTEPCEASDATYQQKDT